MRGRRFVATATLLGLLVGCTGQSSPGGSEPSPTPTGWGPALDYATAMEMIPLEGTDLAPLHWELLEVDDPELAEAIEVAKRFHALEEYVISQPKPDDLAFLFQWVATEGMIEVHYPNGPPDPERPSLGQSIGPVWLWVMEVEWLTPRSVRVSMCRDRGWQHRPGEPVDEPRHDRAQNQHYEVIVPREVDGPGWLVNNVWRNWDVLGEDGRRACEQWAVHEPDGESNE